MKIKLFVALLALSTGAFAQIKFTKLDSTKLPKNIKFSGRLTNGAKWTDSFGVHYVLTTQRDVYYTTNQDGAEFKNAELFAYHYILAADSLKLLWKIYDFTKACEFDVFTGFIDQAFKVTDLDKNGVAEIWMMYENQCTSDVSPGPTKIMMYEGQKKYAIRGVNRVQISEKTFVGGQYTLDDNFKQANPLFQQFGIALWEKNKLKKW